MKKALKLSLYCALIAQSALVEGLRASQVYSYFSGLLPSSKTTAVCIALAAAGVCAGYAGHKSIQAFPVAIEVDFCQKQSLSIATAEQYEQFRAQGLSVQDSANKEIAIEINPEDCLPLTHVIKTIKKIEKRDKSLPITANLRPSKPIRVYQGFFARPKEYWLLITSKPGSLTRPWKSLAIDVTLNSDRLALVKSQKELNVFVNQWGGYTITLNASSNDTVD